MQHGRGSHGNLTDMQREQQQREASLEEAKRGERRDDDWVYMNAAWLEANDPSVKDGLDPAKLKLWRRQTSKLVSAAGRNLRIPQYGIATASLLCNRFFSRRSMKRNDRFLIATACLHLAAKMEESPRPIREVVKECQRVMLGKQSANLKKALEPEELERYKEEVLVAERAVLYTIGFNLNVEHPYKFLGQDLHALGLIHAAVQNTPFKHYMQNTWNFLNDSFRSTLCLQYPPKLMCSGAMWLANEMNKRVHGPPGDIMQAPDFAKFYKDKGSPEPCTFYKVFDITEDQAKDIAEQITSMYEDAKAPSKVTLSRPVTHSN